MQSSLPLSRRVPEEALNPYAPPGETAPLPADPAHLWSVQGEYLLVRSGAKLPPVDLEKGEGMGEDLTPVVKQFTVLSGGVRGFAAAMLPAFATIGWMIYAKANGVQHGMWIGLAVIFLFIRIFSRHIGRTVTALVSGYASVEAMRTRSRRNRWSQMLVMTGFGFTLAFIFGGLHFVESSRFRYGDYLDFMVERVLPAAGIGVALIVAGAIWKSLFPELRCTGFRDDWFYIRGVSRRSLALLAGRTRDDAPTKRLRKVYKLYHYRLPLATLVGTRWNPWTVLVLAILKLRRSPRLVRLHFHWSESAKRSLSLADPALRERWEDESENSELASWTPLFAERNDSPQGDLRVEALVHASPDRRYFCLLLVTRVASGRVFAEVPQAIFRSWTEDGRSVVTSTHPSLPRLPASVDFKRKKGSLPDLFKFHQERLAEGSLKVIGDDAILTTLLCRESEEQSAILEAASIQGPVEEMEIFDPPA